jgi:hypothetical protein
MIIGVNPDTVPLPDFILEINLYKSLLLESSAIIVLVPPLWSSGQSSWLQNGDVLCFL